MSRNQRFTLLALAVALAVAAVLLLQTGDDETEPTARKSAATPEATSTPPDRATTTTPEAEPPKRPRRPPLPTLTSGRVRELEVKQGDTVRFAARSRTDDEVHVHGYDISKEAPAGRTIRMSFEADITGIFEIEFEHAGEPIAELKVEP